MRSALCDNEQVALVLAKVTWREIADEKVLALSVQAVHSMQERIQHKLLEVLRRNRGNAFRQAQQCALDSGRCELNISRELILNGVEQCARVVFVVRMVAACLDFN